MDQQTGIKPTILVVEMAEHPLTQITQQLVGVSGVTDVTQLLRGEPRTQISDQFA
jgi:hypothetical protein